VAPGMLVILFICVPLIVLELHQEVGTMIVAFVVCTSFPK
jgi:hypothetical protein